MMLLEKRKDFISTAVMDSMTLLMIGNRLIGLQLRASVFTTFCLCTMEDSVMADFYEDELGQMIG